MRWFLMALVLLLLGSPSREAQPQVAQEVPCPPKEPNSFCVLRGPLGFHIWSGIAFSPDGRWLAVQWSRWHEEDEIIWVWRMADGELAVELQPPDSNSMGTVQFSPDGRLLANATTEGSIRIWEVGSWKEMHTLRSLGAGRRLAFSPTGKLLASDACLKRDPQTFICVQPAVILWDPYKGVEVKRISNVHSSNVTDLAFLSDELLVTGAMADDTIRVWQVATGQLVRFFYGVDGVMEFEISPNKKFLVVLQNGIPILKVWDVSSGRELGSLFKDFVGLSFSPNGQFLAGSEGPDRQQNTLSLQIWRVKENVKDWQVARTLDIPVPNAINHFLGDLSFSPDGKILAIYIWNAAGREESIQLWYVGDLQ
uniref:WD-40 repeat-containing protein n=2 Tax=Candidatus Bipolaricaulota TaxID=67810 RepID=H5SVM6_ACEAU|nr:WD-40 repeat-containing protein [Candidatus Acetothermum autotrophicum]